MSIERKKPVRLVALDLDGTLLKADQSIGERTRRALIEAMENGVHIVIATGRPAVALPEVVLGLDGVEYAITANGARTIKLHTGEGVDTNCFDSDVAEDLLKELQGLPYMIEVFACGKAYIDGKDLENPEKHGIVGKSVDYLKKTRTQIEDIYSFAFEHKDQIENININFSDHDAKMAMWDKLSKVEGLTVTSSFNRLLEMGGETTSKASAILSLADILGVDHDDIMACGDSLNDLAMLEAAAVAVAMGNAKEEVLAIADFIAPDNENDGVGVAIEKFALMR